MLSLNDSGHLELQLVKVSLAEELNAVIESFASTLNARGFTLKQELDPTLEVCCDVTRIRQALLENAYQHADPGTLTVRLNSSADSCYLSVEDQGPGIPAEAAANVFEAFHRVEPSRSRKSGGSGLGLAVVKAIVEAHGGHAICQSTKSGGTIFTLSWPIQLEAK